MALTATTGLDKDIGFKGEQTGDLAKLDAYLCELKEAQIRDGLHIFGQTPDGEQLRDLTIALARIPRGTSSSGEASLLRAMANDLNLEFDPLDCEMGQLWGGDKPDILMQLSQDSWRSTGDTVERLELLAQQLLDQRNAIIGPHTQAVSDHILFEISPRLVSCGPS